MEHSMEFSMDNPFLFSHHQLEPSYPMEMQVLPNQATKSSGIYPTSEELASEALPPSVPPISGHSHTSPASNPPRPLDHPNQVQIFQLSSDVQDIAAPPMPPPTKTRKRKARTLTADAWNPYKDRIVELHIEQNLPLSKVKETMEKEFGFTAEYVFS
jgi:Clr5 domain